MHINTLINYFRTFESKSLRNFQPPDYLYKNIIHNMKLRIFCTVNSGGSVELCQLLYIVELLLKDSPH